MTLCNSGHPSNAKVASPTVGIQATLGLYPKEPCPDRICPGFQSLDGSPRLRASSSSYDEFLRITSGATPANFLAASTYSRFILRRVHLLQSKVNANANISLVFPTSECE